MLIAADLMWSEGSLQPGLAIETRAGRITARRGLAGIRPICGCRCCCPA